MGLIDRLQYSSANSRGGTLADGRRIVRRTAPAPPSPPALLESLKGRVQDRLFERIGPRKIDEVGPGSLLTQITETIRDIIQEEGLLLTDSDRPD